MWGKYVPLMMIQINMAIVETVRRFLNKLRMKLLNDPTIPLLGTFPREMKSAHQRDILTPGFIAALFIVTKKWKKS